MNTNSSMIVWVESEIELALGYFNNVNTLSKDDIKENINRLKYTIELYEYLNYPEINKFQINNELLKNAYDLIKKY
jgi:ABC-type Na+ transport system ATPase subunit NatA